MSKRVPASMRTRPSLSDLIEGRLASPDSRAELVKLTSWSTTIPCFTAISRSATAMTPASPGTRIEAGRSGTSGFAAVGSRSEHVG